MTHDVRIVFLEVDRKKHVRIDRNVFLLAVLERPVLGVRAARVSHPAGKSNSVFIPPPCLQRIRIGVQRRAYANESPG